MQLGRVIGDVVATRKDSRFEGIALLMVQPLAADGQAVSEPRELSRLVAGKEIGRQMSLTVIRDGSERKLSAEIARLQGTAAATPTARSRW